MLNKEKILELLDEKDIKYEIINHPPVYNMEEVKELGLLYPDQDAKNLFLRDDKKRNYYLVTLKADKKIDLKEFKKAHGTRRLQFASKEDLMKILNLEPGVVGPFGLLNDDSASVDFYLDDYYLQDPKIIGIHPNDNRATVWLNIEDLIKIIEEHGNKVHLVEI